MRGHPYLACTPATNRHAGFVQIYEFKSVGKSDALKFGTHPDQATRMAAPSPKLTFGCKPSTAVRGRTVTSLTHLRDIGRSGCGASADIESVPTNSTNRPSSRAIRSPFPGDVPARQTPFAGYGINDWM
jgi:hypothetical protein